MKAVLKRFIKDERGLETIEYAIMTALIVVGLITVLGTIGGKIFNVFSDLNVGLDATQQVAPAP
ncbi:MAG TPA: Flp family type IVb pilin [Phycisphaerales bacterium]|nr:Flp family type IVb pilin [Phycisphaerales bacterium]